MVHFEPLESGNEMSVSAAERRLNRRGAASHAATVFATNGSVIARGRTSNISENGVFIVAKIKGKSPENTRVVVELSVPDASGKSSRRGRMRTVRFKARIIRTIRLGHLVGIGIAFDTQI